MWIGEPVETWGPWNWAPRGVPLPRGAGQCSEHVAVPMLMVSVSRQVAGLALASLKGSLVTGLIGPKREILEGESQQWRTGVDHT